jgi:ABC-type transport system involved in multi-copper enzyme maturation permease subunit
MKIAFPDDFPDSLSPMLVKELRQGLRTKAFIGVFLTLQIVLGIILLGAGTASTSDHAGSTISNIIFIFFSIAVIIIQPMRGMGALSSEIKGNTIDMMVLTRLSAWRIVVGKWSAIVSQSALILVTIIPYLILRYFFGGMNLVGEVVLLLLIFFTSASLTAVTVGLSASPSVILRSILPMVGIPIGSYIILMMLMYSRMGGGFGGSIFDFCSLETTESRVTISLYITACLYYSFFILSIGTSPPSAGSSLS